MLSGDITPTPPGVWFVLLLTGAATPRRSNRLPTNHIKTPYTTSQSEWSKSTFQSNKTSAFYFHLPRRVGPTDDGAEVAADVAFTERIVIFSTTKRTFNLFVKHEIIQILVLCTNKNNIKKTKVGLSTNTLLHWLWRSKTQGTCEKNSCQWWKVS